MIDLRLSGNAVVAQACPAGSAIFAWPKLVVPVAGVLYVLAGMVSWPWRALYRECRPT